MKLSEFFQRGEIIVALVAGVCLILKVWVIRRWFKLEVNVLDVLIPPILLAAYGPVRAMMSKRETPGKIRWDSPLWWSVAMVLTTAISIYVYVIRIRMVWNG
ncbi:MAG: hypothetical protein H6505_02850 [Calditrichaeota bacterium]|nr:hypothetical protein [Calditrichota bacterium]